MKKYGIIIVGGGAAGMMAGIFASQSGKSVLLIEKNNKLGRKVLATGNGRCNVTNRFVDKSHYHGESIEFIGEVLSKFDQNKVMNFFERAGVLLKEEDQGRIFPITNQAETIANALISQLSERKVDIVLGQPVVKLTKDNNLFYIRLQNSQEFAADKLIIATGGSAGEKFGSSGDGFRWAKDFGHHVLPLSPALVPLEIQERWPRGIQGLKVTAKVSVVSDNQWLAEKTGEVLFTHFGVSGPPVLHLSSFISQHLGKETVKIHLDLFPESNLSDLDGKIARIFETNGKKTIKNALTGVAPANFIPVFLKNLALNPEKKTAQISKTDRLKIAQGFKNIVLTVCSTRPFSEAQVTAGGVDSREINPETMESKIIPGLYLAGEILDVNADSGGFNLQWAWSSGYLAGESAAKDI